MGTSKRGLRMQLTNSLTAREKRAMIKDLTTASEAIEAAGDARDKKIADCFSRGLPLSGLMAATGLGYNTLHKILRGQGVDSSIIGSADNADSE